MARKANIDNPQDTWRAGRGGTGSINGRTTNHDATGTEDTSKSDGMRLGVSALDMSNANVFKN